MQRSESSPDVAVSVLLGAKLSIPPVPSGLVVRRRLLDRLEDGARGRVTLVSAGPGWGKTMLVSSWAASAPHDEEVTWLSLDPHDNDPDVFWSYLLGALRTSRYIPPSLSGLTIRPPVGTDLVRRIVGGLAQLPRPLTLVMDDVSEIHNPDVLDGIADLLRHPSPLRMILLTRTDPRVHLHRLRVDGELTEIRSDDLAFTEIEAADLLRRSGVDLPQHENRRLLDRTEGWAAGLRLAARFVDGSRQAERIDDFAGDEGSVGEYLSEEVLAGLPESRQAFLLRTSVVDRVCAELADVLSDGADGQWQLETLESGNAFVVALGHGRRWFRYHPLMRDLLRHRLRLDQPELGPVLHKRAAHWFAGRNEALEAVRHAIHAADWQLVGRLMVTVAGGKAVSADRQAFAALLAEIPPRELSTSAELRICGALQRYVVRDYPGFAHHVSHARALLVQRSAEERRPIEIFLLVADMVLARIGGDMPALRTAAKDLLERLSSASDGLHAAAQWEAAALSNLGIGLLWSAQADTDAEQHLRAAIGIAAEGGAELALLNSLGHTGMVEVGRGNLRAAHAEGRIYGTAQGPRTALLPGPSVRRGETAPGSGTRQSGESRDRRHAGRRQGA